MSYEKGELSLCKILSQCDFIGREPKLNFCHKKRNLTVFGGLLSVLIYLLMIIGFLYFGQELSYKRNPNITFSNYENEGKTSVFISDKNFLFFFHIRDSKGQIINDYNIKIINYIYKNNTINTNEIKTEQCNFTKYPTYYQLFPILSKKDWLCIKDETNLIGNLYTQDYKYITIQIDKCNKCENINDHTLVIKYINTLFNQRNFESVEDKYLEEYTIKLNNNMSKEVNFKLKLISYLTDLGLMIEDLYKTDHFIVDEINESVDFVLNTKNLISVSFRQSIASTVFLRKYYKVQNLLAEMGGLSKSFIVMAFILNYLNDHAIYYEKLIDKLFDVDDLHKYFQYYNKNNKKIFKKYRDSILLRNTKALDFLKTGKLNNSRNKMKNNYLNIGEELKEDDSQAFSDLSTNPYIDKLKKDQSKKEYFEKIKKKRFSLNSWQYLLFSCKKKSANVKRLILDGGKEIILNRTNIIYILKKMLEFDRFKGMMLNDTQQILLNSLSKFMLDPEQVNLVDFEKCTYEKFIDAYASSLSSNRILDINLCTYVRSKFHLISDNDLNIN